MFLLKKCIIQVRPTFSFQPAKVPFFPGELLLPLPSPSKSFSPFPKQYWNEGHKKIKRSLVNYKCVQPSQEKRLLFPFHEAIQDTRTVFFVLGWHYLEVELALETIAIQQE